MELRKDVVWVAFLVASLLFVMYSELQTTQSTTILFGDEGTWASLGRNIAERHELPDEPPYSGGTLLYVTHHTDTSFYPLLAAGLFTLGGEALVKASSPALAFLASMMVFLFIRRLHGTESGVFAALAFAAIPSFVTYSVLVYVDVFAVLLATFSLYLLYRGISEKNARYLLASGVVGGFVTLTKETGFLLVPVYIITAILFEEGDFKSMLKKYAPMALAFLVLITPWYGVHNYMQYGIAGIPYISGGTAADVTPLETVTTSTFAGSTSGGGTEAGVFQYGLLNFASFAYTLGIFFAAVVGFTLMVQRRSKEDIVLLFFTVLMLAIPTLVGSSRAENAARFALPAALGVAAAAGLILGEVYKKLGDYGGAAGKAVPLAFVVAVAFLALTSASARAESLAPIKVFPAGFYEGCDWIRENTPEDAQFMTLWASRAHYHCERDFYWDHIPGYHDIILGDADTSYEYMKANGIDYIYVQKFSYSVTPYIESYPAVFLQKLQDASRYENVYENEHVIVYKVN